MSASRASPCSLSDSDILSLLGSSVLGWVGLGQVEGLDSLAFSTVWVVMGTFGFPRWLWCSISEGGGGV